MSRRCTGGSDIYILLTIIKHNLYSMARNHPTSDDSLLSFFINESRLLTTFGIKIQVSFRIILRKEFFFPNQFVKRYFSVNWNLIDTLGFNIALTSGVIINLYVGIKWLEENHNLTTLGICCKSNSEILKICSRVIPFYFAEVGCDLI